MVPAAGLRFRLEREPPDGVVHLEDDDEVASPLQVDLGARAMRWWVRLSAREVELEPEDVEHLELEAEDYEAEVFLLQFWLDRH